MWGLVIEWLYITLHFFIDILKIILNLFKEVINIINK